MTKFFRALRIAAGLIALFLFLLLMLLDMASGAGNIRFLVHLIGGFIFFLNRNIPAITVNAATWVPGLLAFLASIAVGHQFLRTWATQRNHTWSFKTTFCLGMIIPVLFMIAFIVPGMLLQLDVMQHSPWFQHERNQKAYIKTSLRNYAQLCKCLANEAPDQRYPNSLAALEKAELIDANQFSRYSDPMLPAEPFIYLGAGLTLSSNKDLPLLISSPYLEHGRRVRQVITLAEETIQIPDEVLDSWINRGFPKQDAP